MDHSEFKEFIEHGYLPEDRVVQYVLSNVVSDDEAIYMATNRFDISMILNGRVPEDIRISTETQDMIRRWNEVLGFTFIFED